MRVKVKDFMNRERECELSDALTPFVGAYEADGAVERAEKLASKTAEAFGRLAELLVEKEVITLDEAREAAGYYGDITPVEVKREFIGSKG